MGDISTQLEEWWRESLEIQQRTWTDRARENMQFYAGQQWTAEELEALKASGRPAMTINTITTQIDTLSGHQRQNRRDIVVLPRKGGNADAAQIFTAIIKHALDSCRGQYQVSDWYWLGLIASLSWLEVDIDYERDPVNGNLVMRTRSPFTILEDQQNLAYEENAGRFIFSTTWQDKDVLKMQYPRLAADIDTAASSDEADSQIPAGGYDYDPRYPGQLRSERTSRQALVRECWYKTFSMVHKAVHLPTQTVLDLNDAKAQGLRQAIDGNVTQEYRLISRLMPRLHRITKIGEVVLEEKDDPLGHITMFPFIRFAPRWLDGHVMGVIDNLKDPQRVKNKTRSQFMHAVSQGANQGWKIARESSNPEDMHKLERHGSMPGVVIDESKYGGKAERLEPAAMPAGLMTLAERADRDIPEVSGINSDLMGTKPNDSESGRARLIRQEAGLVATEIMSDNFARSVNTLGELLLNVIRFTDIYSDEEIGAIVEDQHLVDFMDVDPASGRTVVHLDAMNDWHVGEYGVVVADSPNRPTVREANFDQAAQLVQMGVSVPPDVLIDLSDMPDKEKVKQRLAQAQGQLAAGAAG